MALASAVVVMLMAGCGTIRSANALQAWLGAASGGADDLGWSLLSEATRRDWYRGDRELYIEEAASADWARFEWGPPRVLTTHDGFARIVAPLLSPASTVPRFMLDRRIVHGVCEDGEPVAIGAYEDRRPFEPGGIGGGGLAGSGVECNALFTGE